MPVVAASLSEAIALTNSQSSGDTTTPGRTKTHIAGFNAAWPATLLKEDAGNRTVLDWIVESTLVEANTPAAPTPVNVQQVQNVVNVACRVMYAAQAAVLAGRITPAQEAIVLAAWNASFGAVP